MEVDPYRLKPYASTGGPTIARSGRVLHWIIKDEGTTINPKSFTACGKWIYVAHNPIGRECKKCFSSEEYLKIFKD